jgi:hypothetical protein
MGKQFKLDPRNKAQQGFRIKLLVNKLQTLDQYKQYRKFNHINTTCRRCCLETETQQHFFTCQHTISAFEVIKATAIEILDKGPAHLYHFNKLLTLKEQDSPTSTQLIDLLGATTDSFLTTHTLASRGIVSTQTANRFKQYFTTAFPHHKNNHHLWLRFTLDAWLTALFSKIWIPRNKLTWAKNSTIIPLPGDPPCPKRHQRKQPANPPLAETSRPEPKKRGRKRKQKPMPQRPFTKIYFTTKLNKRGRPKQKCIMLIHPSEPSVTATNTLKRKSTDDTTNIPNKKISLTSSMNPLKRKLTDDNINIPNKKISFIIKPPKKNPR